ncbi:MAG: cupin domain-containing protein [Candidatus Nanopelagicales bacterium]
MPDEVAPQVRALIDRLGLQPHVEGGWWAQTWLGEPDEDGRPVGTAIVYLLARGESAAWHRVDVVEDWHFHAGDPLLLRVGSEEVVLGPDVLSGQRVQQLVPPGVWQSAQTTGDWSLVGCSMAPGWWEPGYELAPPGWEPSW